MVKKVDVVFLGRDRAEVEFRFAGGSSSTPILAIDVRASGCSDFLSALERWRSNVLALPNEKRTLRGSPEFDVLISDDVDHVSILIRELILRARDEFVRPYLETELCHCRAVPTDVVDRAIVSGCHSIQSVARTTSAGTSCGTCKPDTEKIIVHRLNRLAKN